MSWRLAVRICGAQARRRRHTFGGAEETCRVRLVIDCKCVRQRKKLPPPPMGPRNVSTLLNSELSQDFATLESTPAASCCSCNVYLRISTVPLLQLHIEISEVPCRIHQAAPLPCSSWTPRRARAGSPGPVLQISRAAKAVAKPNASCRNCRFQKSATSTGQFRTEITTVVNVKPGFIGKTRCKGYW